MKKINVIVVPEKKEFIKSTTYKDEIYITKNLGVPKLQENNAKYVAPFWLDENHQGVNRVFHIKKVHSRDDCTVLELGNSFLLDHVWNNMSNHRSFSYHDLSDFNLKEITDGLLF